jgi:hypothetical protein
MKYDEKPLTNKLQLYAENIARGMASFPAAKAAGYRDSYARVIGRRTKNNPMVAEAVEQIRKEGMKMAVYDLATAMAEAEAVCAFAKKHKNAMACCTGTELRARLSGFLIEKVEVATIDLRSSLDAARSRVLRVIEGAASPPSNGSISWAVEIPGSAAIEDGQDRT